LAKGLLAAALLFAGATPAQAQLARSSVKEIATAVQDCSAAAGTAGIAEPALAAAGWSRGKIAPVGEEMLAADLSIYSKAKASPIIMTDAGTGKPGTICVVLAGLRKPSDYQAIVNSIDALEGTSGVRRDELVITFSNGRQIIQSALTGKRDKPAVRIAVMAVGAGKK
jgi:hypothetical protein